MRFLLLLLSHLFVAVCERYAGMVGPGFLGAPSHAVDLSTLARAFIV